MQLKKKLADIFSKLSGKRQYPIYKTCSFCGVREYLPFHCEYLAGISVTGTGCRSIMIAKILMSGRNNLPGH